MSTRRAGAPATLLATLFAVVSLTGCGSSSGSGDKTAAWADDLCGSLVTWRDSVKSAASAVKDRPSAESLDTAASTVSDATAKLRSDVDALGKPPTPVTSEAKATLTQLGDDLNDGVRQIKQVTAGISSAGDAVAAIPEVAGAVAAMGDDISAAGENLKGLQTEDGKWKQAFDDSEACGKLASG